ncbi:MAG: methyltransferase [Ferruginibacter sp.]
MSNNFFRFKQFTIQQERCAMKVCTDACILGAWTANTIDPSFVKNILDIGCGTGLLSLMLAQKIDANIDAIEINKEAASQAEENISNTAWSKNIQAIHTSLQDFVPLKKYELIISNPPFYEDDLRSGDEHKDAAKHDTTLKLEELILFIKKQLSDKGIFAVLLPFQRVDYFEKKVNEHGLFLQEKLLIKQSPQHDFFRAVIFVSKHETLSPLTIELIIHDNERQYTGPFKKLLEDYYLKL